LTDEIYQRKFGRVKGVKQWYQNGSKLVNHLGANNRGPGTRNYALGITQLPSHVRTLFKYIVIASEYFWLAHSNFPSKIMSFAMGLSRFSARNTLKTIFNPNVRRSLSTVCEKYEILTSHFVHV
jgi:hypothetical protein